MHRLLALLLCAWLGLAAAQEARPLADDPVLEAQVQRIATELRCLVCQNETIAASHADLAVDLRKQIRLQLQQGRSEQQILDFMVQRYGDFVLYRPPVRSSTWLLWGGPFVLLGVALLGLVLNIRRRRASASAPLQATDSARARRLLGEEQGLTMAGFWIIAGVLLLLALAMLLGALRGRPRAAPAADASASNLRLLKAQLQQLDQELAQGSLDAAQHRQARAEIERRVLDEESVAATAEHAGSPRATMALLLVALPLLVGGLYALVGNPAAISPEARTAQAVPTQGEIETMVAQLAERLEQRPPGNIADLQGWVMLGRSYTVMQRYEEAGRAFARALQLSPNDVQVLVDQADVLAMQQGGRLAGQPLQLIERALQLDPANLKALALAGTAAFDSRDFEGAAAYWTRARGIAAPDSDFARSLERNIAEARSAAGTAPAPAPAPASATATATATATAPAATAAAAPASAATSISGRVSVAPALASRVAPGDTLFVFARAAEGPRMPLAILKRSAAELPLQFTLDDSMAMTPQLKLSGFVNVVIGARVSKSGDAMPQSGDLEGQVAPPAGSQRGIELVIDRVRP